MNSNRDFRILVKKIKKISPLTLLIAIIITVIGAIMIYSATYTKNISYFNKDIIWIFLGLIVYFIFSLINYNIYKKYSIIIYIFNIAALLSVHFFGNRVLGAKRWITIGNLSIQPSEFAKIFIVLTLSVVLVNKYKTKFYGLRDVFKVSLHIIPVFLLILKQPDLGTSLTLIFIFAVLIFVHGIDWKTINILIGSVVIFIPIAYFNFLKEYQKTRILTFLDPEKDILGSGWNVIQSMIAVGSGGLIGKGLFHGTQSKLKFLPESHTDFIGAVFLEETGFIGGFVLISLYFLLIYNIIKIGKNSEDKYGSLICYGIAAIIFFHTAVNLGMITGIMPVTGLPLLLMSYGGTSFIFTFMMLGIVQSVKIHGDKY